MEDKKCPKCGSKEIGKGKMYGYGRMHPIGKIFSTGSDIYANVCTECGYILEMKVASPNKFKGNQRDGSCG